MSGSRKTPHEMRRKYARLLRDSEHLKANPLALFELISKDAEFKQALEDANFDEDSIYWNLLCACDVRDYFSPENRTSPQEKFGNRKAIYADILAKALYMVKIRYKDKEYQSIIRRWEKNAAYLLADQPESDDVENEDTESKPSEIPLTPAEEPARESLLTPEQEPARSSPLLDEQKRVVAIDKNHTLPKLTEYLETYRRGFLCNNAAVCSAVKLAITANLDNLDMSGISIDDFLYLCDHEFGEHITKKVFDAIVLPASEEKETFNWEAFQNTNVREAIRVWDNRMKQYMDKQEFISHFCQETRGTILLSMFQKYTMSSRPNPKTKTKAVNEILTYDEVATLYEYVLSLHKNNEYGNRGSCVHVINSLMRSMSNPDPNKINLSGISQGLYDRAVRNSWHPAIIFYLANKLKIRSENNVTQFILLPPGSSYILQPTTPVAVGQLNVAESEPSTLPPAYNDVVAQPTTPPAAVGQLNATPTLFRFNPNSVEPREKEAANTLINLAKNNSGNHGEKRKRLD